jgi:hypothetical protein
MITLIYAAQLLLHLIGSLGDVAAGLLILLASYKQLRTLVLQLRISLPTHRLSRFAAHRHTIRSPVGDEDCADAASD